MSDFFTRLAERQLTTVPAVAPRVPPRFAPAPALPDAPAVASPRAGVVHEESLKTTQRVIVRVDRERPPEVSMAPSTDNISPIASPQPELRLTPPAESVAAPQSEIHRVVDDRAFVSEAHERLAPAPLVAARPLPAALDARDRPSAVGSSEPRTSVAPRADPPAIAQSLVPPTHEAARRAQPPAPVLGAQPPIAPAPAPITVTIGRIEVRAVTPPSKRERTTVDRHTALSLTEYLDGRHRGRR